eukprot:10483075-Karenia_brevis.AAC.1
MKGKQARSSAETEWEESLSSLFGGQVFVEISDGKGLEEVVEGIKAHVREHLNDRAADCDDVFIISGH